jgi:hypothetical protein
MLQQERVQRSTRSVARVEASSAAAGLHRMLHYLHRHAHRPIYYVSRDRSGGPACNSRRDVSQAEAPSLLGPIFEHCPPLFFNRSSSPLLSSVPRGACFC